MQRTGSGALLGWCDAFQSSRALARMGESLPLLSFKKGVDIERSAHAPDVRLACYGPEGPL